MAASTYKCANCGGYLAFDPQTQKWKCPFCDSLFDEQTILANEAPAQAPKSAQQLFYRCQNCGSEIMTDETTAATRCYFCHSPVVLHDRLDDEFRPDGVIPFQLDKDAARQKFIEFVAKKKFIDRSFFSDDQLEMFSGVYYPYWYADVEGEASFEGEGTNVSTTTTPTHIVTTTRVLDVKRKGNISLRNLARKALNKVDGKLADGIHPFDCSGVKPYASGYLSGFLAEKRDIEKNAASDSMINEARNHAEELIKRGHSFNSLKGETTFKTKKIDARYVLLPTWVLTYPNKQKKDDPYYYAMNGCTGEVCGKLPIDKKKLYFNGLLLGAAVFVIACLVSYFLF